MHIEADANFYTEGCCDELTINGNAYKGLNKPINVQPVGMITWSSDPLPNGGTGLHWRLCPVAVGSQSGTDPTSAWSGSSGGGSDGWVLPVVLGSIGLVLAVGALAGCFFVTRRPAAKPAASSEAGAATVVRPAPRPPPSAIPPMFSSDGGEDGRSSETKMRLSREKVVLPESEGRLPRYWKMASPVPGTADLQDVGKEDEAAVQSLLDNTFKTITTRDRRTKMPRRLKLARVQRIENPDLWKQYASGRYSIRNKRPHKCTPVQAHGGEVVTFPWLPSENKKSLEPRINEVYLWHGTTPAGAMGISNTGFSLQYSGTKTGSMYGNGVYFAECSSKSDEYAADEQDGIYRGLYCLLLCRVVLGECLRLPVGGEATHTTIQTALESKMFDSVLGDRAASVGTYREFIVYQEDQVYPEYLILYQREE